MDDAQEINRINTMLTLERMHWGRGIRHVAGVDEAGRGPLAGPVVAAAVIFPEDVFIPGVKDSKKLSAKRREFLYPLIEECALGIGVGIVHESEIDRINILQATYKAMRVAIDSLKIDAEQVLVDGVLIPDLSCAQKAVVGGDRSCYSIAAASIIAKVTRDRMMVEYDEMFPDYGFAQHKGYGTKQHVAAIQQHGPCPIHRKSFQVRGWGK